MAGQKAGAGVQCQVAEGQLGRLVGAGATQHGAHPAQQFIRVKGLGQIVVRSGVEAGNAVVRFALGGQHHDGGGYFFSPQLLQHLNAIHLGHHHVQNNGIVLLLHGGLVGVKAVVHRFHRKMVLFKKDAQYLGKVLFVLCNQQPHCAFLLLLFCPQYSAAAACCASFFTADPCRGCSPVRR